MAKNRKRFTGCLSNRDHSNKQCADINFNNPPNLKFPERRPIFQLAYVPLHTHTLTHIHTTQKDTKQSYHLRFKT